MINEDNEFQGSGDGDEESFTDKLAAEAAPPEKPAGSPPMRPLRTLKAREKSRLLQLITPVMDLQDGASPGAMVGILDVALDVCEMLAVDHAAMEQWIESDGDLGGALRLFEWYMDRFKVGEAFASLFS